MKFNLETQREAEDREKTIAPGQYYKLVTEKEKKENKQILFPFN